MPDLHHDLRFGAFVTPSADDPDAVVRLAAVAEAVGLDLVTFQDHPYQPRFLDTWTLLSYLAARTERIGLAPNVANVPLRPPAVLARSVAALDRLTGGRVELGLGAGYFRDAIRETGGPDLTAGQAVDALDEAIDVIRALWRPGPPVHLAGRHHRLDGARPGPPPAHDVEIWVGAYGPRMLALTAAKADGWVPTLAYADPDDVARLSADLDRLTVAAGRAPADVRRLYNVSGVFGDRANGFLQGPPALWAEQLADLVLAHGFSAFLLAPGADAAGDLERFADEVAPAVRDAVAAARQRPAATGRPAAVAVADASAESRSPADTAAAEAGRLVGAGEPVGIRGRQGQQTLLAIHQHLREELAQLRDVVEQVRRGQTSAAAARSYLNDLAMRQNFWTLGSFCAAFCRVVATHHAIEDQRMFVDLRTADPELGPVLDRLTADHERISDRIVAVDEALVAVVTDPTAIDAAAEAVDALGDLLLRHLDDEEDALLDAIGRLDLVV